MDKFGDCSFDKPFRAPYLLWMTPIKPPTDTQLTRKWLGLCGASGHLVEDPAFAEALASAGGEPSLLRLMSVMADCRIDDAEVFATQYLDELHPLCMKMQLSSALSARQIRTLDAYGRALDDYTHALLDLAISKENPR